MPSAANEIFIDRPRDRVFAFLADPENDPRWRNGVLDLTRVSGDGVGARYAQAIEGPGGRRIGADIEITELTPGETIAVRTIAGPVRPRGRYVLAAADEGRACASSFRPTSAASSASWRPWCKRR